MRNALILLILTLLVAMEANSQNPTKYYGHRGCRGLFPENTLEAFQHAIDLGVDGIEWDVVVTKDNQLIISHEPYLDGSYCRNQQGKDVSAAEGKKINFYDLTAAEIQKFDCGSKPYPKYPEQKKLKTYKPTVQEAFETLNLENVEILFEVKSEESDYGVFQPQPEEYAQLIADEVANFAFNENIIFMSFDANLLEALHKILPDYRYVYLTYKPFVSVKKFLQDISFTPFALGMYHPTVSKKDVNRLHQLGIKAFAWTVNKADQAKQLIKKEVDGIITDYPDRVKR